MMATSLAVTRVLHACVLLELPGGAVLTDPWFRPAWPTRLAERPGLLPEQLPRLAAVLGGHGVPDHWQIEALRPLADLPTTPILVATPSMARKARRAGCTDVEVLRRGQRRELGDDLAVTSVPGERITGMATNGYVLESGGLAVYVGTEARRLAPLRDVAHHHRVDVALLPVDGARLLGRRLVMDAATAVEATLALGATTLVPIHHGQRPLRPLLTCRPGELALAGLAAPPGLHVVAIPTGRRVTIAVPPRLRR